MRQVGRKNTLLPYYHHNYRHGFLFVLPSIIPVIREADASLLQSAFLSSVRVTFNPRDAAETFRAGSELHVNCGWFSTVGISQKIKQEDGQSPRICPRCNNGM